MYVISVYQGWKVLTKIFHFSTNSTNFFYSKMENGSRSNSVSISDSWYRIDLKLLSSIDNRATRVRKVQCGEYLCEYNISRRGERNNKIGVLLLTWKVYLILFPNAAKCEIIYTNKINLKDVTVLMNIILFLIHLVMVSSLTIVRSQVLSAAQIPIIHSHTSKNPLELVKRCITRNYV